MFTFHLVRIRPAIQLHSLQARLSKSTAGVAAVPGAFRKHCKVPGITVVHDRKTATRALKELRRLQDRSHAWDTEAVNVGGILKDDWRSPVTHGQVICATCFCGDDADFGNGPRLLIDNDGPANGLLQKLFKGYFEDIKFKKVFHNYSFDRHLLARHDIRVRGFHADTLHLARLIDTSLASWEGREQRIQAESLRIAEAEANALKRHIAISSSGGAVPVMHVTLGGMQLEKKSWSAGASMLHTSVFEHSHNDAGSKHPSMTSGRTGYGLKDLARHYGLTTSQQDSFSELFGSHSTAAADAHNSETHFGDWAHYATNDAVLTHQLFERFHGDLTNRPWFSAVHQRPIREVLADKRAVADLKSGQGGYGFTSQHATGRTMWDFFELYMRDFAESLADLEEVGIGVDSDMLARIQEDAKRSMEQSHGKFVDSLGAVQKPGPEGGVLVADADLINIHSSQQLQTLLFGGTAMNSKTGELLSASRMFPMRLPSKAATTTADADRHQEGQAHQGKTKFELQGIGLNPIAKRKNFTQTGQPKTGATILNAFAGKDCPDSGEAYKQLVSHGFPQEQASLISDSLQELKKAKTTRTLLTGFARPLHQYAKASGRIHPQWKFDTATGRLACRKPNLQNLPNVRNDAFGIRSAFHASPGNVLVVADYSQLEMKILAHVTNCQTMVEKFLKGGDYHSEVAVEMFSRIADALSRREVVVDAGSVTSHGLPTVKEMFPVERNKAKAVNFAIIYGQEAASLAEDLNVPTQEAEELMAAWYRTKPEVRRWRYDTIQESTRSKHALSILGRWRTLPLIDSDNAFVKRRSQRAGLNFAVQGSAADVVLAAMLRIWKSQELKELGFRLVLQVHDEFVLEGPEDAAAEASELVRQFMLEPFKEHQPDFKFKVPLTSDIAVGRAFSEAKA